MQKLIKTADKLLSEINSMLPELCCTCNKSGDMDPGHYLSRTWKATRWDLRNVHRQCRQCNIMHEQDESKMTKFMEKHYKIDLLRAKSRELCKRPQVEEIIKVLSYIKTLLKREQIINHYEAEKVQEQIMNWPSIEIF